jgi:ABC-2 type transport system permease protein
MNATATADRMSWSEVLQTSWIILSIALQERLVYRGDFAIGTLMRFLPIITQIFLWWAIFESLNPENPESASISGYTFSNMVAYYLLTMVGRAFSSMPGLATQIARQIREGDIKKFLVQPVDMIGFMFLSRVAHKIAYYTVATIPFALVFYLCRGYFTTGFPDAWTFVAFLVSLVLGFMLGFYLEAWIGLIGFWFLEVSSLLFVYMLLSFFLSGHMFPIDILPEPWESIVSYLPFKYLAYFPAAVYLQKIQGWDLVIEMCVLVGWTLFFYVLTRVCYHRGLVRYSGYGG